VEARPSHSNNDSTRCGVDVGVLDVSAHTLLLHPSVLGDFAGYEHVDPMDRCVVASLPFGRVTRWSRRSCSRAGNTQSPGAGQWWALGACLSMAVIIWIQCSHVHDASGGCKAFSGRGGVCAGAPSCAFRRAAARKLGAPVAGFFRFWSWRWCCVIRHSSLLLLLLISVPANLCCTLS